MLLLGVDILLIFFPLYKQVIEMLFAPYIMRNDRLHVS